MVAYAVLAIVFYNNYGWFQFNFVFDKDLEEEKSYDINNISTIIQQ